MLETLRALFEFIRQFIWPVYVVAAPYRAVRYTFGQPTPAKRWGWVPCPQRWRMVNGPVLAPGWYFAFPLFQEIRQTNCAEDCVDVSNMPLTTWDGEQMTISYNMRYRIVDVLKFQTNVQEASTSLHAEASCEVALRVRRREWKRIYRSQGSIERRITKTMTERVADWGIEIMHGGITICTKAKPISWIKVD